MHGQAILPGMEAASRLGTSLNCGNFLLYLLVRFAARDEETLGIDFISKRGEGNGANLF